VLSTCRMFGLMTIPPTAGTLSAPRAQRVHQPVLSADPASSAVNRSLFSGLSGLGESNA
jgi:hypothetical protein